MAVYIRADSPYYWMLIERRDKPPVRESTRIPVGHRGTAQSKELRRQAEALYFERMSAIARTDADVRRSQIGPDLGTHIAPLKRSPDGWCYVYIVQHAGLVKIGRAVDVAKRLRSLQTGNGHELQIVTTFPAHAVIEKAIQDRFKYLREQGEWFHIDRALMTFIEKVQQGANPIALLWE